ncbi:hypothetical protein [Phenylobacterium sp.]|uniref:hypothetical protein n=1 Tax=Phenylobacterium sp. TaxID=1871053 RepID=UPI002DF452F1|nr:hypothetical protein [Phenylobacterium sp.]
MAERHALALAELAELGLVLTRKVHARAMAAETAEEERAAVLCFHRITRSLRQTLALEAQLERLRSRLLREELAAAEARIEKAVGRRKAQVKSVVERLVWREHEGDEADALVEHLDELLNEDALAEDFLATALDDQIERLRGDLGLKPDGEAGPDEPAAVIPRSGDAPDPGDPSGASSPESRPGSPASPCGRAADEAGGIAASPWAGTWPDSS